MAQCCFTCKEVWMCRALMCWGLLQPQSRGYCWAGKTWPLLGKMSWLPGHPFWGRDLGFLCWYRELLAHPLRPQGTRLSVNIWVSVLHQKSCSCSQIFSPQFLVYFSKASSIDSFYWLCLCNQSAVLSCSINLEFKVSKYCLLGVYNACLNELCSRPVCYLAYFL